MRYRSGAGSAESSRFNLGGKHRLSGGRLRSVLWQLLEVPSFSGIVNLSCLKSNCHCGAEEV